jgi:phospholipase C
VDYVPTIFDRLDAAGLSWSIYASPSSSWGICPYFYECLGSRQHANMVGTSTVLTDAENGNLPNYSIVTPTGPISQHNGNSMAQGDNWIGQIVSAIANGPDWSSTAIFVTHDDCGCFYDHVPPPDPATGIRVPMVIVSPYARPGFTDSTTATYVSMLAYVEHAYSLAPLTTADANAYDYADAFDYSQTPLAPVRMVHTRISASERAWIAAHPPPEDPT